MPAKRTCCGLEKRHVVLALTIIHGVFAFVCMGLSIMIMCIANKANLDKDYTAQDRDRDAVVATVSAIVFGLQGAWAVFGFVSAFKRMERAFKAFTFSMFLTALAHLVSTFMVGSYRFTTSWFNAISCIFHLVYYHYATEVMPEEIKEAKSLYAVVNAVMSD
ncbi:hypothetical protein BCR44DRAFT_1430269 [Catenaria anguillulae PL171]|uniref:Uncharacterized protein n=1 Tax=Catenaria anguillulae PL171 TaxID=765915 RepID=A0A1Y2HUU5_9FUNG|nr:hypothetical protein BCR44DRAFT_1430269 [Catenaria anguillulae PL171]